MKFFLTKDINKQIYLHVTNFEPLLNPDNTWESPRKIFIRTDLDNTYKDLMCTEIELIPKDNN